MKLIDAKNVKFNGRFLAKDDGVYFYHVGSGITFFAKGKTVKIKLSFLDKEGFISLIKNRNYEKREKILISKEQILQISLNEEVTRIDIVKINEVLDNTLVISEIDGEIVEFINEKAKKIKVYGDSTIAGFGILGKLGEEISFLKSDGVEDFCFRGLYKKGYDYNIFAASGWGLVFSIYTEQNEVGIIHTMDYVSPFEKVLWSNDEHYDLLIVSLGTNDWSFINQNFNKKEMLFDVYFKAYEKLILKERKNNPNLPVLMVYGTLNESFCYELNEYTYKMLNNKYNNIYIHKFDGDSSAISNHAFVAKHEPMSEELVSEIEKII